jgi:hypothetical protein
MTTIEAELEVAQENQERKSITIAGGDEDETHTDSGGFADAPDGGLEAWLVAAAGACIFFSCLGFANAFGIFQEYYMTHQLRGRSADEVAWIGSLTVFIQFAGGAIGGPLFDRYGAWVCLLLPKYLSQALISM